MRRESKGWVNGKRQSVLVVGPLPPPVGGVETVTQAVLESPLMAEFRLNHCDLTKRRPKETQGKFDLGNFLWALVHFWRMIRAVLKHNPAVVYMPLTGTWSGFWRDCALCMIGKLCQARIIGHIHGGGFDRMLRAHGLAAWLVRLCLERFDILIALGTRWERAVLEYGYRGEVLTIPPMPRREIFEVAKDYERIYDVSEPVGLYVGHVGVRKGVLDLLDAIYLLKKDGKPVRMVVVGPEQRQGDWRAIMQKRDDLGLLHDVEFTGPLVGERLYAHYRKADYFILPSHIEGLPVVFMEAGAFGLPVIGTTVGAVGDLLVHGENGLLVHPRDVNGIARAIERLQSSSDERKRLGMRLRTDVMRFHPDQVTLRIAQLIRAQSHVAPLNVA